jgi:hypothetical protein
LLVGLPWVEPGNKLAEFIPSDGANKFQALLTSSFPRWPAQIAGTSIFFPGLKR